jgi:cytochrome c1
MRRVLVLVLCFPVFGVWASEAKLEKVAVLADPATLERGAEVVTTVCNGCHSLKYIKYLYLVKLGVAKEKVDVWRGTQPMESPLAAQMSPEIVQQSFGIVPPDLSLITKAREGGPSYVYSFLLGFYVTPEGMPNNHVFPNTRMPDILNVASTADAAQRAELQNKARDVASFLAWAADPKAGERRTLGYYVIGYLVVLTVLLYLLKRRVWAKLK